jgi:hypothetical protein
MWFLARFVLAGILGGSFGIHTVLCDLNEQVADLFLGATVLLALILGVIGARRLASTLPSSTWAFVCLGVLPLIHVSIIWARDDSTVGCFAYMYKMAPYCSIPYWVFVARRGSIRSIAVLVKALAIVTSVRLLLVFFLPGVFGVQTSSHAIYDGTYLYSMVGGWPRVKGPGTVLLVTAVLVYVAGWARREASLLGFTACLLAVGGIIATQNRSSFVVLVLGSLAVLAVTIVQSRGHARGLVALSLAFACSTILGIALLVPGIQQDFEQVFGDRVTLDDANIVWRDLQLDRAFTSVGWTWRNTVFGAGTNTFVLKDQRIDLGASNELHYSFVSIYWTFGLLGIGLLMFGLIAVLVLRCRPALKDPACLSYYVGTLAILGYAWINPAFTWNDTVLALMLCVSGAWEGSGRRPVSRKVFSAGRFGTSLYAEPAKRILV